MPENGQNEPGGRRDFFKRAASVVIGGVAMLIPIAAGLAVFLDPLRRKSKGGDEWVRVASLDATPNDKIPRKFSVIADRVDAWNKFPQVPIGAVYLRRVGEHEVEAFNVVCPHAGGFIDFVAQEKCFVCPLHNSRFALDGSIADPKSPTPRPMDSLPVEIRNGEIWVRFENFRAGTKEKTPA